jgi:cysteine synthase
MIDLTRNEEQLKRTVKKAQEQNIIIPTFAQMKNPETVPTKIKNDLKEIGLWDVNPKNLFRVTWKNEPTPKGGNYGGVNYIEIPKSITGVDARIIGVVGKWFPTGAHKVGASLSCLAPRLITGQFDPSSRKAVWPSTGNYCRGGAYISALLGCESIAILPEEMSKERFEWLKQVAGEVIATPGCESNVKEIYDKCWELKKTRGDDIMIFNQFEEFGNHLWHYEITGNALEEIYQSIKTDKSRLSGAVFTTGSAGTIAAGDFLKELHRECKIAGAEAVQCPTLWNNGFGGHRIEGIGDKHVPWIHNVKNTDMIIAIDDEDCMKLTRLFNEPAGHEYLNSIGVEKEITDQLELLGISGIANMLTAIKMAKYYEMTSDDVIVTCFTDSMELYGSRLEELTEQYGEYKEINAAADHARHLMGISMDYTLELSYYEKQRVHNLKYYTWIEQQGRELSELNAQWYDEDYWNRIHAMTPEIDKLINEFNQMVGLL